MLASPVEPDKASEETDKATESDKAANADVKPDYEVLLSLALKHAEKVHGIPCPHHLRGLDWCSKFGNGILEVDTEESLSKKQLVWRRLDKALVSLTTSIKNAAATVKRHMLNIQTDKAKQDKKAIQASDKLKLAEQKEELQGRARKVMSTVAE